MHVYVGPDRKLFTFPETLLCDRFEFFESAFQSGFRESLEKAIDLPEDDPVAFAYVIDHAFQEDTYMTNKVAIEEVQLALAKVYVLADKLGRPDLVCDTESEYRRVLKNSPSLLHQPICPRGAKFVYENTSESSRMRRTMVDLAVEKYNLESCFTAEWMKEWLESATSHPQFHFDVMIELKKRIYHENDDKADCNSLSCINHSI